MNTFNLKQQNDVMLLLLDTTSVRNYQKCPMNTCSCSTKMFTRMRRHERGGGKDNRDRCSYDFIISSVCGTLRRLAYTEHRSALINIPLGPTKPMTSLLLNYPCKSLPPTQSALQEVWISVGLPQVPDIQLLL